MARDSGLPEKLVRELYRIDLMRRLEDRLASCGFERIAGVDEAGRGCLAGPVVAAAVVPDPTLILPGVDDSKLLPAELRDALSERIRATALTWAVAAVPAHEIDASDILAATRVAMRRALAALSPAPDMVVTDAVPLSGPWSVLPVVRGDVLSYAVASASIVAKSERDRLMRAMASAYPHYGFGDHKGYGAPVHLAAIARFGPSPEHRLSFARVVPRHGDELASAREAV